jgi:hypothetical protein
MSVERQSGMTEENEEIGEKPVQMSPCPQKIQYADPGSNPGLRGERTKTNCLSQNPTILCYFYSNGASVATTSQVLRTIMLVLLMVRS